MPEPLPMLVPLAFFPRVLLLLPPSPPMPMTPHPCRASCSYRLTKTVVPLISVPFPEVSSTNTSMSGGELLPPFSSLLLMASTLPSRQ
ncbi:hypothetical protein ACHAW5_004641 [Stephanodiscus triporus]|uniref:Secreted protein n=1 Tax=Stephanodiscus triporus TaxID=2934178 RepID=A0ABD3MPP9_9STRA